MPSASPSANASAGALQQPSAFLPAAAAERPDADYPMVLITGRQLEHWHTGAMTRRSGVLDAIEPEPTVSMNPLDMREAGVKPGDFVQVQVEDADAHDLLTGYVVESRL